VTYVIIFSIVVLANGFSLSSDNKSYGNTNGLSSGVHICFPRLEKC